MVANWPNFGQLARGADCMLANCAVDCMLATWPNLTVGITLDNWTGGTLLLGSDEPEGCREGMAQTRGGACRSSVLRDDTSRWVSSAQRMAMGPAGWGIARGHRWRIAAHPAQMGGRAM